MSNELRRQLARKIEAVFANREYPKDDQIVQPDYDFGVPSYPEIAFKSKNWNELSIEHLFEYREYIYFLTPKGFRYFFPAFLKAVLLHPEKADSLLSNLKATLTPPADEKHIHKEIEGATREDFLKRVKVFEPREKQLILEFLERYLELYSEPQWELVSFEKERLQRAVRFWRQETSTDHS